MITESELIELLKTKSNGILYHREGQCLEFKQQFNFAGLAEYIKDFAAFANNKGGLLIFGITDVPRKPNGLSVSASEQFEKIDPETISNHLLEVFSGQVEWEC